MNGWIALVVLMLVTGAGIWHFARPPRGSWELVAAALLAGAVGYAWQGQAAIEGAPRFSKTVVNRFDPIEAELRLAITGRFGPAAKWMTMSDGLARSGDTQDGANVILSGLKENPGDATLWLGLANALVTHGQGALSPAAEHAYRQALRYDKEGVATRFFYGLALARSGKLQPARDLWAQALPLVPADHPLHAQIQRNIGAIDQALAAPQR